MVREKVVNLFSDVEGFEEADELVQKLNARKRGFYQTKAKLFELSSYHRMKQLYSKLANFLPRPLFTNEEAISDYDGIRVWHSVYLPEEYEYEGKIYVGEQFTFAEAEIIGTENFNITDRIMLHEKLIKLLRERVELKNAVKLVQQDVKELQKKYEVKEFTLWLKEKQRHG